MNEVTGWLPHDAIKTNGPQRKRSRGGKKGTLLFTVDAILHTSGNSLRSQCPRCDYMLQILCVALALHNPGLQLSRRTALCVACVGQPIITQAATPIQKGAPVFGTAESRTGLIDGIKSAFSDKSGEMLAADYAQHPADVSGVGLPKAFETAMDVAIIFHGSGGPDRETSAVLNRFREQDSIAGLNREVIVFNWMPWFTSNTDRLSFQSASVGDRLGRSLAENRRLRIAAYRRDIRRLLCGGCMLLRLRLECRRPASPYSGGRPSHLGRPIFRPGRRQFPNGTRCAILWQGCRLCGTLPQHRRHCPEHGSAVATLLLL